MPLFQAIRANIATIMRSRMSRLTTIAVVVLPLLYSALYLWAFWDPYARMKDLPAGVVNLDEGAIVAGHSGHQEYGKLLVDSLLKSKSLKWTTGSRADVQRSLRDRRVYFYLEIPRGFSEAIASASTTRPRSARLRFVDNEASNVLMPQIGGKVVTAVRAEYAQEVTRQMVTVLLDAGKGAASGVTSAAAGAQELATGATSAAAGASRIATGLGEAGSGANRLSAGLSSVDSGVGRLATGLTQAVPAAASLPAGLAQLRAGVSKVSDGLSQGARQVSDSVKSLTAAGSGARDLAEGAKASAAGSVELADSSALVAQGAQQTSVGATQLAELLATAASSAQALASDPQLGARPELRKLAQEAALAAQGSAQLRDAITKGSAASQQLADGARKAANGQLSVAAGAKSLADGLASAPGAVTKLAQGLTQAGAGLGAVNDGLARATAGAAKLSDGLGQLSTGATSLHAGSAKAAKAAGSLAAGLEQLSTGASQLRVGTGRLAAGTSKLAGGLAGGAKLVSGLEAAPSLEAARAEAISNPVVVDNVRVNSVDAYGTGFAPYFLALSLWVGALLLFFAVDMHVPGTRGGKGAKWAAVCGKFGAAALFAVCQALLSCGAVHLVLGSPVRHVAAYYLLGVLTSLAFTAVVYLLVSALGMAGRLVALVLLMLQLTSCGGTFPPETIPGFFRAIKPWLPATYTVSGLKSVISGPGLSEAARPMLVLAGVAVLSVLITPLFVRSDPTTDALTPRLESVLPGMSSVNA